MDKSVRNVAALLGSLGQRLRITTAGDRKFLQKITYLGQALGLPRSYQFNWYKYGPYSPRLTDDYYELWSRMSAGEDFGKLKLDSQFDGVAAGLRQLLDAKPVGQTAPDWVELLASIVFLEKEAKVPDTKTVIEQQKAQLVGQFEEAVKALRGARLVGN